MPELRRVFHHYERLEETKAGMWRVTHGDERKAHIAAAAFLMRNPERFEVAMRRAIAEWPLSCENALTAESTNRLAWLGHAGCCIATGSPEEATRAGWHTLTPPEQDAANAAADRALLAWRQTYSEPQEPSLFSWANPDA